MVRKGSAQPSLQEDLLAIKKQVTKARGERKRLQRTSSRQRRALVAVIVAALVIFIGMTADGLAQSGREGHAQIADYLPVTWVWSVQTGQRANAIVHQFISSGDTVQTSPTGSAHVEFPDSTLLKLGPATTFAVSYVGYDRATGGRTHNFQMSAGRVWARVAKLVSGDSTFSVSTPSVIAGVRGTRFAIAVSPGSRKPRVAAGTTYLSVYDGQVRVKVQGTNQVFMIGPGQEVTVVPASPGAPQPFIAPVRLSEQLEWQRQRNDATGVMTEPSNDIRNQWVNFEEQQIVRPLVRAGSAVGIPGLESVSTDQASGQEAGALAGATSYASAMGAARSLQTILETNYDASSGYPGQVGLTDLAGLNVKPSKARQFLSSFARNQLVSYRRAGTEYELYVRAQPPSSALIRITPDTIEVVHETTSQ